MIFSFSFSLFSWLWWIFLFLTLPFYKVLIPFVAKGKSSTYKLGWVLDSLWTWWGLYISWEFGWHLAQEALLLLWRQRWRPSYLRSLRSLPSAFTFVFVFTCVFVIWWITVQGKICALLGGLSEEVSRGWVCKYVCVWGGRRCFSFGSVSKGAHTRPRPHVSSIRAYI